MKDLLVEPSHDGKLPSIARWDMEERQKESEREKEGSEREIEGSKRQGMQEAEGCR